MMKLRKGDQVKIISGNDRGKQGKILAVLPRFEKVVVEGLNLKKKHVRARRQGQRGEVIRFPAPVHASRVMLICPSCTKASRVGFRIASGGKRARVCKRCAKDIL